MRGITALSGRKKSKGSRESSICKGLELKDCDQCGELEVRQHRWLHEGHKRYEGRRVSLHPPHPAVTWYTGTTQ